MIEIADEKLAAASRPNLAFRCTTAEHLVRGGRAFDAVLGFDYLHLVGDLRTTLDHIRALTRPGGIFVSKTPSVADMNVLIRLVVPLMQLVGKAPHVNVLTKGGLAGAIGAAGFEVVAIESHTTKGRDDRPFIAARGL